MVSLSQYILHTMGLKPLPYWKSFWYQTPCRIFSISDVFSDSIHTIQNLKGEMHFHDSENIMVPDKWFDFLEKFWLEKEDAKNKTTFRLLLAGWSFIVLNWIQFWNWGGGWGKNLTCPKKCQAQAWPKKVIIIRERYDFMTGGTRGGRESGRI